MAVLHLHREAAALASARRTTCEVEPHRDAAHVVPIGELDIAAVPMVEARLGELHEAGFRRLVLDLRQVTFMDVAGLRLVLRWAEIADSAGATSFVVMPAPPAVQRIFELTGTADRVSFLGTTERPLLRLLRGRLRTPIARADHGGSPAGRADSAVSE